MTEKFSVPPYGENAKYLNIKGCLVVISPLNYNTKNWKEDILEMEYIAPYLIGTVYKDIVIEEFLQKYDVKMLENGECVMENIQKEVTQALNNPDDVNFPKLFYYSDKHLKV